MAGAAEPQAEQDSTTEVPLFRQFIDSLVDEGGNENPAFDAQGSGDPLRVGDFLPSHRDVGRSVIAAFTLERTDTTPAAKQKP